VFSNRFPTGRIFTLPKGVEDPASLFFGAPVILSPMSDDSRDLAARLKTLEARLAQLVQSTREDLDIARALQRTLMPNRLPEVPGLTCYARYIGEGDLSAEGFDLIPTKGGAQVWLVGSWTERFGLGSLLLQSLVSLQSRALVEAKPKTSVQEVFNELSIALTEARKSGHYRLHVARLDMSTLQVEGCAIGSLPLLRRSLDRTSWGPWDFVQSEALRQRPELLAAAVSAAPVLANQAYAYSFALPPGSRLFYLGASWLGEEPTRMPPLAAVEAKLGVRMNEATESGSSLLEDLNALLKRAEDALSADLRRADLATLAFDVDPRRLHLA